MPGPGYGKAMAFSLKDKGHSNLFGMQGSPHVHEILFHLSGSYIPSIRRSFPITPPHPFFLAAVNAA